MVTLLRGRKMMSDGIEVFIRTLVVLIAPFLTAPTARVERRQDLANMLKESYRSKSMIHNGERVLN